MRLASTAVALAVLAACGGAVPLAGRAQNVQDYRVFLGVCSQYGRLACLARAAAAAP